MRSTKSGSEGVMNKEARNSPAPWQAVLIVSGGLLCVALILFLKMESDSRAPIYQKMAARHLVVQSEKMGKNPVAVPDTIGDPTVLPLVPDTVPAAVPDTLQWGEVRPATLAGQEDGYLAGQYDASLGQHRATYDESNTFSSSAGQQAYAIGYAEGYERGYAESMTNARGKLDEEVEEVAEDDPSD